jgi:hypothetical protein
MLKWHLGTVGDRSLPQSSSFVIQYSPSIRRTVAIYAARWTDEQRKTNEATTHMLNGVWSAEKEGEYKKKEKCRNEKKT